MLLLALLAPAALMALALTMDWIERAMYAISVTQQLEEFLATADADEVEALVTSGFATALSLYWHKRASTG